MRTARTAGIKLRLLAVVALCTGLSGVTWAQGFEYNVDIRAGIAKSDNIFLAPAPGATEETTYTVSPSIGVDYSNQRVDGLLRYQYDWYRYADLDSKNEYHRYDARLNSTVIKEALYLDFGASRSQSVVDPNAVIPPGGLPISNNLADRDEYFVNPRLEKVLGRSVTVMANYRYADIRYDDSNLEDPELEDPTQLQDNTNQQVDFKLENYKRGQGLTWAVAYEWDEAEYDLSLPWEYNRASAELGFWAGGSTRLFASGGKESAWDDPSDRSLQDEFWEAGFAYQNADRASAEFAAGERSFGSSWRGRLDWSARRGNIAFSYAETPTTTGLNSFSPGNLISSDEPNDYLADPRTSERYIEKRAQASLTLEFRRTSFGFVIYDEERTGRFSDDGTQLEDEKQQGISADFSWQLGVRTELTASGSLNNRQNDSEDKQDYITGGLSASYRLGSNVGLTLDYRYDEQDPEKGSSGQDYVSNIVSFFVTYSF